MKRNLLLEHIANAGCVFIRHGKEHDIYKNPKTGIMQSVPRHNEIPVTINTLSDVLIKKIVRE
jgi:predicted RNA binding protein YcfA (HicA-like mRNA interferase family)